MKFAGCFLLFCVVVMTFGSPGDDHVPDVEKIESMEGSVYNTFTEAFAGAILNQKIPAEVYDEVLKPLRNARRIDDYQGGVEVGCIFMKINRNGYLRVILFEDSPSSKFAYFAINGRVYSVQPKPGVKHRPRAVLSRILYGGESATIKLGKDGEIIVNGKE
jgi:hypothetical protein